MPKPTLADLREDYRKNTLDVADVAADPVAQFENWFAEAAATPGIAEPNAMTLATASADGQPSARIVLLKAISAGGFCFFTNFESRKGAELAENPVAALVFWWPPLERQVRIEGRVEKIAAADSEEYFQSRPKTSQIGGLGIAPKPTGCRPLCFGGKLEKARSRIFVGKQPAPAPILGRLPAGAERVEFWQGRSSRLHDRILFSKKDGGGWQTTRLAP